MMVNVGFLWGFGQVRMGSLAEMTGIAFSSTRRNRIIGNPRINLIHRQFPERIFGLLVQDIWGKFQIHFEMGSGLHHLKFIRFHGYAVSFPFKWI